MHRNRKNYPKRPKYSAAAYAMWSKEERIYLVEKLRKDMKNWQDILNVKTKNMKNI